MKNKGIRKKQRCRRHVTPAALAWLQNNGIIPQGIIPQGAGWAGTQSSSMPHSHRNRHWLDPLSMQADVVAAGRERVGWKGER